jgi:hypothetical protein
MERVDSSAKRAGGPRAGLPAHDTTDSAATLRGVSHGPSERATEPGFVLAEVFHVKPLM